MREEANGGGLNLGEEMGIKGRIWILEGGEMSYVAEREGPLGA